MESYFVFEVYYKYGEFTVCEFSTQAQLEDYLRDYVMKHEDVCPDPRFKSQAKEAVYSYTLKSPSSTREEKLAYLRGLKFSELVKLTIRMGEIVISEQAGYGIVKVIKGVSL